MQYQAILFDLDGTLLPMKLEPFAKAYFLALAEELAPFGIPTEALIKAVWGGTKAMMQNDGTQLNVDVFWAVFTRLTGLDRAKVEPLCDAFYASGFHKARVATGANPLAAEAVRLAHEKAPCVVLATNPLFPIQGQQTRLSWIGLSDADFDLVTCYSSDRYCKPNPAYYLDICHRLNLDPTRCLMIGNDDREDMEAATATGMDAYLITDCRIPHAEAPWQGPQGSFTDLLTMLRGL